MFLLDFYQGMNRGAFLSFFKSLKKILRAFSLFTFLSLTLLFAVTLIGCKSFIKAPPATNPSIALGELELAQILLKPNVTPESRWLYGYRLASVLIQRKDLLTACSYLLDLMREPQFPLRDLALLKAYLHCSQSSYRALPPFHFDSYASKEWTHSLVEDIYLQQLHQSYIADSPREVLRALVYFADKYKKLKQKNKEVDFLSQASAWIEKHPKMLRSHRQAITQRLYAFPRATNPAPPLKKTIG